MSDRRLEQAQPSGAPTTVLQIGPDQTHLAFGHGAAIERHIVLNIGARKTSSEHFKHSPPSPYEMETAIMIVEDEIARAPDVLLAGSQLRSSDAGIREIALLAGLENQTEISLGIDELEMLFDRLAYVVQGRPGASEDLPTNAEFCARLLILREFMHHLGFPSITIATGSLD